MIPNLHLDWEIYSEKNLKLAGAHQWLSHYSSWPLCLCYSYDDGPVMLWTPEHGFPTALVSDIKNGINLVAFNAQFERLVAQYIMGPRFGWAIPHLSQWECCQARAAYFGLSRKLEEAAQALGIPGKDLEGHKIMKQMTKPDKNGNRPNDPEKLQRVYAYCGQDVRVEVGVYHKTIPLPPGERALWMLDQKINDRGVPLDLRLCNGACSIKDALEGEFAANVSQLTNGVITKATQRQRIGERLTELGVPMELGKPTKKGKRNPKLDRVSAEDILEGLDPDSEAGQLIQLMLSGGAAAAAKFVSGREWAAGDGRARGTLKFYAAGPGRWGGEGVQLQNLRHGKPQLKGVATITSGNKDAWKEYCPIDKKKKKKEPYQELSKYVRAMVRAPKGRKFVISDLNAIEFRVSCWLAGQQNMLELLINGGDLYRPLAAKIYGIPVEEVNEDQRGVGKGARLGTIYGSGWQKFQSQTKQKSGIVLPEQFCRTVIDMARGEVPEIVDYWRVLAQSALAAVKTGQPISAGRIWFYMKHGALVCQLPNGRELYYQQPTIRREPNKFRKHLIEDNLYYKSHKGWILMGGWVWMENVGQGTARDLLAESMLRLEEHNVYCIMSEHDKVVVECAEDDDETPKIVTECMQFQPSWADGLPIKTETVLSRTFGKPNFENAEQAIAAVGKGKVQKDDWVSIGWNEYQFTGEGFAPISW